MTKEMELLRMRMIGYDVTKSHGREKKVHADDKGVLAVEERIEAVLFEEYLRPPELYGRSLDFLQDALDIYQKIDDNVNKNLALKEINSCEDEINRKADID